MLYKVSPPREDDLFLPTPFWRTEDFKSSSSKRKKGYIQDTLLYAGEFNEIIIHLLPKVRRVRIWNNAKSGPLFNQINLDPKDYICHIFANASDRTKIETFQPTIHKFDRAKFSKTPSNEFVSRQPVKSIGMETFNFLDCMGRWNFLVQYKFNLDHIIQAASELHLNFSEQT